MGWKDRLKKNKDTPETSHKYFLTRKKNSSDGGRRECKTLLKSSKETTPDAFIRLETEQPGITTVHGAVLEEKVPTIDYSDPDEEKVLSAIEDAARNWGMFQILNHEIPSEAIAKLQAAGKGFFELSPEEK